MKLTLPNLGLLSLIIYFTFIGGTFYSQLNFTLRVANFIIVTLILGVWLLQKLRRGEGLPRTYLDGAIGLYLLASLISALGGQSPRFSLEQSWFTLVHTLAFYLLVDLLRRGWAARLTWAFLMASAAVCLVGLIEFMAWYIGTPLFGGFAQGWLDIGGWQQPLPPVIYRLAITLNGSTPLSAYLALLIPPAIGLFISLPRHNPNRSALVAWLILAFTAQILTFSRAGVLALLISLGLMAGGWYYVSGKSLRLTAFWQNLRPLYRAALLAGIGLIVVSTIFWWQQSFANRQGSTDFRFGLWRVALTVFENQPLSGAGPGNFGRALLRLNQADLPRQQIGSAHNVYLNTAAELGLLGLLAGGYLLLRVGLGWRERWRQISPSAKVERLRLIACGAALAGLAAQTLVDTYGATPIILVMLALAAYSVQELQPPLLLRRQRWLAYGAAALLGVYAFGLIWLAQADWYFQRSIAVEQSGNLPEAVGLAQQAAALDPYLALPLFRLAWLEAKLAEQKGDPATRQAAIEHYRAGLNQEPIWGLNSANLAGVLWAQGQRPEAIETLQQTLSVEKDSLYWVNLGYFYEQMGRWAEAAAAYGQALGLSPALAGSGFWTATPERAHRWPDFAAQAVSQLKDETARRQLLVSLALARQEFEAVVELVGPVTAETGPFLRAALAEAYLNLGRLEPAEAALRLVEPTTARDFLLWGRLNQLTGDLAAAEKAFKTAIFLGDGSAYFYLGQLYEQQGNLRAAETAYWRSFSPHYFSENIEVTIYGRPGNNDLLAPPLLRLGVGPAQAAPWLALARLFEAQQRFDDAQQVYELLRLEDPFLPLEP